MNFNLIEGAYANFDSIHDDFCQDYLWSDELSNPEIRKKYELSARDFNELTNLVKKEFGVSRRNTRKGRYYYKVNSGFVIQKTINCVTVYFGIVPSECIARKLVELCKKVGWNVDVCKDIVKNWKDVIT
ncbi:MAG: hypothetical protein IKF11_03235 [Methanobrevibacter sp.]|nr:hypothetical protein [Methanobrevibacter sp.]